VESRDTESSVHFYGLDMTPKPSKQSRSDRDA